MSTGLQTIINSANGLAIDRRKVVGIQYTRNEIPRVSQTPTLNPWHFTLDMPARYRYSEARALMEELDTLDRITPQIITFSNVPQFSWMFAYQGELNVSQLGSLAVVSFVGNTLTLDVSGITASPTAAAASRRGRQIRRWCDPPVRRVARLRYRPLRKRDRRTIRKWCPLYPAAVPAHTRRWRERQRPEPCR